MEGYISPVSSESDDDEVNKLLLQELQYEEVDINIHFHCELCVRLNRCHVSIKPGWSCEIINCPLLCGMRFHKCKLDEHNLLCSKIKVPCINECYGCPQWMQRATISAHLPKCPASVVVCSCERNRWVTGAKARELVAPLPGYMADFDSKDIDVSYALHDQALVNQLYDRRDEVSKSSVRHSRYPVLPLESPITGASRSWSHHHYRGIRSASLATDEEELVPGLSGSVSAMLNKNTCDAKVNLLSLVGDKVKPDVMDRYVENLCSHFIHRNMCRFCKHEAPPANVMMRKVWRQRFVKNESGAITSEWYQREIIHKIRRKGPLDTYLFQVQSDDELEVSDQSQPMSEGSTESSSDSLLKRFKSVNVPELSARSLKLELTIENYSRHQSKPKSMISFQCLQVLRRDEFADHCRTVHCDLLGEGLEGRLLMKRCPLMSAGCPYSTVVRTPFPLTGRISFSPELQTFGFVPDNVDHICKASLSASNNNTLQFNDKCESSLVVPTALRLRAPSPASRELSPDGVGEEQTLYVAAPHLLGLPQEILQHILSFLDGFSLSQAAVTCPELSAACAGLVKDRGLVLQYWHKTENSDGGTRFYQSKPQWVFSTSFGGVNDWRFLNNFTSDIASHLQHCTYYERNIQSEKFSYGVNSETSLKSLLQPPFKRKFTAPALFR